MVKRSIKVNVDFREEPVEVMKSGLLTWGEITSKFDKVINSIFEGVETMTDEEFLGKIPTLISENIPRVIEILEISTPLTREELEQGVDPSEALELIMAVIEVNNLLKVNEQVKKLKAMFR